MSRVLLLATGDTIAHRHSATPPAVLSGAELLAQARVPDGVTVTVEDVLAEPSWDISPATMLAIARRVRDADEFDGVVVTHGLDTIEDTALLTDLFAGGRPTVFTGASCHDEQAGRDAVSDAIAAAAAGSRGTTVCLGGTLRTPLGAVIGHVGARVTSTAPLPPRPPPRTASRRPTSR